MTKSQVLRQLPEIFAVDDRDGRFGRIEIVDQTRIDADPAADLVPASVRLEGRTVRERGTSARGAEMVRYEFRVPAIGRVVACRCCQPELFRRVVCPKGPTLGTEGACAPGKFFRNFAFDTKDSFPAVAASGNIHVFSPHGNVSMD